MAAKINDLPIALLDKIIEKCFKCHSGSVMYFFERISEDATMNINLTANELKRFLETYRSNGCEISLDIVKGGLKPIYSLR